MSNFTINSFPKSDDSYILIWPSNWHFITVLGVKLSSSITLHSFPSAPFRFTGPHLREALTIPVYSPALLFIF